LKYARRLGDAEAQKLISDVAFGVSLGIVPNLTSSQLYKVMMSTRPAIIAERYGQLNAADRDVVRADIIKQVFS
jgi:protein-arginine kinase